MYGYEINKEDVILHLLQGLNYIATKMIIKGLITEQSELITFLSKCNI